MKKKVLSILCVLVLLLGVLGLGSMVSAANGISNLQVGYAKISIDPIDVEGTYRTIDYTSIYNETGNDGLKEDLQALIDAGDPSVSVTRDAEGKVTKLTYTVKPLAEKIASGDTAEFTNDANITALASADPQAGYFSVPLGGYGSTNERLSVGKMDDNGDGVIDDEDGNFITCIAVTDQNGNNMLFFSMDLISAADYAAGSVREGIRDALKAANASYVVPASSMMFSASHTHSSPDTSINNAFALPINAAQRAYEKLLIAKTKEVAIAAMNDRSEVTVSTGEIQADNMNATRHYNASERKYVTEQQWIGGSSTILSDQSISWVYGDNFGHNLPGDSLVNTDDVIDTDYGWNTTTTTTIAYRSSNVSQSNETLQLVQFTPTDEDDPIVMVNFRAHPKLNSTSTLRYGIDNKYFNSSDYVGTLREKLAKNHYRASFIQGAAGNQNTWNYLDDTTLLPGVQNTENGAEMYEEIMRYREPDGTSVTAYNDTLAFFRYTSLNGTTINAQSGFSYGARLADYALQGLYDNMQTQNNGVINTKQAFYTGAPQLYSEGLTAAAVNYKENSGTFQYQYKKTYDDAGNYLYGDDKYYNLNSIYHANSVYGRRNATENTMDCKLELNCITIGPLAFVSAPNELYDRYNYDGDQVNNNLWDVFNDAANDAGYVTPIVLGYTNGAEGYIPNVAAYEYNQANNDAGSLTKLSNSSSTKVIGVGAYEANTSKFAPGSGEQIIGQFQSMLLSMEEDVRPTTCPMCGQENVQWEAVSNPLITRFDGGHFYLSDDLAYYNGTNSWQKTVYADSCVDLNGHTVANSSTVTGRAFNVLSNVTLRLMNGTVKGRGTDTNSNGGVINMDTGSSLYLTNVDVIREIHEGQTANYGGTIYANKNTNLYIKDSSITGGTAGTGGNLYVYTGATLDMDSVIMEGGTATGKGDNICCWTPNVHIYGDTVLKGECYFDSGDKATTKISGNVQAFESPDGENIKLATNTRLTFEDLAETAKISIQGGACVTDTTAFQYAGKQLVADEGYYLDTSFTNRGVFAGDKWMCECGGLAADKHTCEYHAYSPWTSSSSLPTVGNIYLKNDVTIPAQASPDATYKTLRIDLAGHSITHKVAAGSANTRVFGLNTGTTLVLTDTVGTGALKRDLSNLSAAQLAAITNYGIGVCVNTNGTFRMYGGTIDMQGQSTTGGGAIAGTVASSVIEIYGGTIKGASANYGGGIYSKGTVKLYGGLITEGKSNYGGGVCMAESAAKLTLTGDASVTGNYKTNGTTASNINAAPGYLTISGPYTGTAGINVANPAKGTVVAASDAADISHAILSVDGNAAYTFAVDGNSVVLTNSEDAVAVDANGNYYAAIQDAVNACGNSGAKLTLLQEVTSDITVNKDTAVELAGHSITGAIAYENGAKLIISDSSTADYTVEDGNGYATVPYSTNVAAADKHLLYVDGDVVSAHAYDVKLTGIALRPKAQGIYYTSSFKGDECVKSMVAEFGISLRVNYAPDAAYIQADPNGKTHTCQLKDSWVVGENDTAYYGTLLENIMMAGNGASMNGKNAQIPVYGMPYIKLSDGTYLFGGHYSCSLKDLVELVDSKPLYKVQKEALVAMYSLYKTVMADWNINQIKDAYLKANPFAEKTASFVGDSITYGASLAASDNRYWQNLATSLDLAEATGFGVAGSCYSTYNDRGHNYQPLADRYQNIAGNDLIFIFMGTNDFSHETPLGTTEDTEDISLCGAMNIVLNGLKAAHPDSQIVLLTPIQRYDMSTNDIGLTLEDYVNTIKTVGAYHDIPVLDLYTPSLTQLPVEYFADQVHPTAEGHVILANMIQTLLEENKTAIFG